ncbi:MAG: ATP-dependent DNA helicase RecG [Elusimicrobia bacterium]|nr:ATP-dependent DNA helicase RecG [Elusimicrobiota bacterium]
MPYNISSSKGIILKRKKMSIENSPVQYLKGVGEKISKKLSKQLGVKTVADLLYHFPRDWEDRTYPTKISELKTNQTQTVRGKIEITSTGFYGKRLLFFKAVITDGTGSINAVWIRHYMRKYDVLKSLKDTIKVGSEIIITGSVKSDLWEKTINVSEHDLISNTEEDMTHTNRIVPLYPLTSEFTNRFFRGLVKQALSKHVGFFSESLPKKYLEKYGLCGIKQAIRDIHFPGSFADKEKARNRLAFDEFLSFQLKMEFIKQKMMKEVKEFKNSLTKELLTSFRINLPFKFTPAQKRVISEIFDDMLSPRPMNRLLQGDVGSGKTVVAVSAMLLAKESGYQSVLLAPTEILAEQHFLTVKRLLKDLPVKVSYVVGKMAKSKKLAVKKAISSGSADIIIGTHVLLEEEMKFKNLSLVVIDEQHRFGVDQRMKMRKKSGFKTVDLLLMTATPIPRTLGLTLYGDMSISTIDELPPGRISIKTLEMTEENAYNFVKERIRYNEQVFIVYPLVGDSEKLPARPVRSGGPLKSAIKEAENLGKTVFKDFSVGLIHGRMKLEEKEKIMSAFADKKYDILISTTVIEVGIDIPNATVMLIEHAERYGLATLHQLRGRVGRSDKQSYCILLSDTKMERARERIRVLLSTTDGFKIAEEDLRFRGPGEFFGTEQSGIPEFRIGNIFTDMAILRKTKDCAREMLMDNPALAISMLSKVSDDFLKNNLTTV